MAGFEAYLHRLEDQLAVDYSKHLQSAKTIPTAEEIQAKKEAYKGRGRPPSVVWSAIYKCTRGVPKRKPKGAPATNTRGTRAYCLVFSCEAVQAHCDDGVNHMSLRPQERWGRSRRRLQHPMHPREPSAHGGRPCVEQRRRAAKKSAAKRSSRQPFTWRTQPSSLSPSRATTTTKRVLWQPQRTCGAATSTWVFKRGYCTLSLSWTTCRSSMTSSTHLAQRCLRVFVHASVNIPFCGSSALTSAFAGCGVASTALAPPPQPTGAHADDLANSRWHPTRETLRELQGRVRSQYQLHSDDLTSVQKMLNAESSSGLWFKEHLPTSTTKATSASADKATLSQSVDADKAAPSGSVAAGNAAPSQTAAEGTTAGAGGPRG